jgi:nitrate/TMAO reductase-like tetraheme cytochrome c subunit
MSKAKTKNVQKSKTWPVMAVIGILLGLAVILTSGGFVFAYTQEEQDTFCSSCHTQPESTFFLRSSNAPAVDLASFHKSKGTRCIDCHSGSGLPGRMQAEMLGAHNAFAWYTGTAIQPAKLTYPIRDDNCLKCHQQVTTQRSRNNHFHGFLAEWQAIDPNAATCMSCHGGHTTDSNAQNRFQNQVQVRTVCDACHSVTRRGD